MQITFYIPKDKEDEAKKFLESFKKTSVSYSPVLVKAIEDFNKSKK